jgi:hypothetical protein
MLYELARYFVGLRNVLTSTAGSIALSSASLYSIICDALDAVLLIIVSWMAFALRLSMWWPPQVAELLWLFIVAPLAALPVFYVLRVYHSVLRYMSNRAIFFDWSGSD